MRGIINIFNHQHLLVCVHAPRSLRDKINTEKPPSRVCKSVRRIGIYVDFVALFSKTSAPSKWIRNLFIFVRDSSINSIPREFLRVPIIITREETRKPVVEDTEANTCKGNHHSRRGRRNSWKFGSIAGNPRL